LFDAIKELHYEGRLASAGEVLLASVDRAIAKKQKKIRKIAKLTKKKIYGSGGASS
jgi:hypothetical protein